METKNNQNQMNVTDITINDLCFGEVKLFIKEDCLHIYNSKSWICGIALEDIKNISSNNSKINSEVNKFILKQI